MAARARTYRGVVASVFLLALFAFAPWFEFVTVFSGSHERVSGAGALARLLRQVPDALDLEHDILSGRNAWGHWRFALGEALVSRYRDRACAPAALLGLGATASIVLRETIPQRIFAETWAKDTPSALACALLVAMPIVVAILAAVGRRRQWRAAPWIQRCPILGAAVLALLQQGEPYAHDVGWTHLLGGVRLMVFAWAVVAWLETSEARSLDGDAPARILPP
jgi:hypothetical protein